MKCAISLFAVMLAMATAASAQPVYKSTMPDGKVVYSEKPQSGATRIDKIEPPPAKTGVTGLTPEERARAEREAQQRAVNAAAAAKGEKGAEDARRALQQAEAARDAGKEPLPDERVGIAGGGSRLNEAYFARQKALEDAVIAARKRAADSR
jgi:hypothetical protein